MFMLVNKRPYVSCANDVKMCVLEEKKFIFVNRLQNRILGQLKWNKEYMIRVKLSFKVIDQQDEVH